MKRNQNLQQLVTAALLCAVGIVIPMFSPIKVVLEPASFTLASHVAVFLAMFLSPSIAASVALGTTLGFFLGGFPLMVVARAASHVVFAVCGAWLLKRKPLLLQNGLKCGMFAFGISILHGFCEVLAVLPFYATGSGVSSNRFFQVVIMLVGVGSVVHSLVDFGISLLIWNPLRKTLRKTFASVG